MRRIYHLAFFFVSAPKLLFEKRSQQKNTVTIKILWKKYQYKKLEPDEIFFQSFIKMKVCILLRKVLGSISTALLMPK